MDRDKEKCVIVVDETLSLGMAANTAVILGLTLGEEEPSIIGPMKKVNRLTGGLPLLR